MTNYFSLTYILGREYMEETQVRLPNASELPSNFTKRMNVFQNYHKSAIRVLPLTGSSPVRENGYLKFALSPGSVLDLRTICINFWFQGLVDNKPDAAKLVGMPKYTASLIDDLDIWINGRSVQKLKHYGWVYHLLQNYKTNYNATLKEAFTNPDPSVYTHMGVDGDITKHNTYVQSANANINSFSGHYCWNNSSFSNSFLGTCEPSILDTNLLGNIEIHIRLAGSEVLFAAGLTAPGGGAVSSADKIGYEISDIVMYVDKLDFKDARYYDFMQSLVNSPQRLRIPYTNYDIYTGQPIGTGIAKTGEIKITESCESLQRLIFSFMDNTAPLGKQTLQLGNGNIIATAAVAGADAAGVVASVNTYLNANFTNGKIPATQYNFTNLLASGDDKLLNTSVYHRANGLGMGGDLGSKTTGTVQFRINSQDATNVLSLPEMHQETLKCFELNEADDKQINPCIKNINLYERDYFCVGLSTSHINDKNKDKYVLVSGLDTQSTSMNLSCRFVAGRAANDAQLATPVLITEFISHLIVAPGRNVLPVR